MHLHGDSFNPDQFIIIAKFHSECTKQKQLNKYSRAYFWAMPLPGKQVLRGCSMCS